MKKPVLFVLSIFTALTFSLGVPFALADPAGGSDASSNFVPLAPVPGLTKNISPTEAGIATFLNNVYIFMIGIAVILAVVMIIWGGAEYALSEAITSKSEGRKRIMQALFGLVLVLAPALVFSVINPAILNLDVNVPKLNTPWGLKAVTTCTSNDCSPVDATNNWVSPNIYQGYLPCDGSDCSKAASACKVCAINGTRRVSGSATGVCLDSSTNKYSGGATGVETAPASCPTGSSPAILCTLTAGTPVISAFFSSC